jgi:hypothetical protein
MPGTRIFLPQCLMDSWTADGRIRLEQDMLVVPEDGTGLALSPAVRFMREVGGGGDPAGLIGKVKTMAQLEELGADHYRDSVLVGESAYEVVEGFCAVLAGAPTRPPAGGVEEEATDAESLARLLIEKLD